MALIARHVLSYTLIFFSVILTDYAYQSAEKKIIELPIEDDMLQHFMSHSDDLWQNDVCKMWVNKDQNDCNFHFSDRSRRYRKSGVALWLTLNLALKFFT